MADGRHWKRAVAQLLTLAEVLAAQRVLVKANSVP